MGDNSILVSEIEIKVRKLAGMLERQEAKSRQLMDERINLLVKIEEQHTQVQQLEEKIKKLVMADALTNKDDAASVKQKINELVREVDRCLAMLNK